MCVQYKRLSFAEYKRALAFVSSGLKWSNFMGARGLNAAVSSLKIRGTYAYMVLTPTAHARLRAYIRDTSPHFFGIFDQLRPYRAAELSLPRSSKCREG